MILGSLLIGAITAYYFGFRKGGAAALAAFILFALGLFMPSKILWAYGLVGAYTLTVIIVGPRMPGRKESKADFFRVLRKTTGRVLSMYRKLKK